MAKLTVAEKRRRAAERIEDAAADLLRQAELWSLTNRSFHDIGMHRRELFRSARRYASAMRLLARGG
jgi:hypothetical protein